MTLTQQQVEVLRALKEQLPTSLGPVGADDLSDLTDMPVDDVDHAFAELDRGGYVTFVRITLGPSDSPLEIRADSLTAKGEAALTEGAR